MNPYDFDLVIAYRQMAELEEQVEHARLVKKLKEARKEQPLAFWRKLIGYGLIKLGQRLARVSIKAAFVTQSPSRTTKDQ